MFCAKCGEMKCLEYVLSMAPAKQRVVQPPAAAGFQASAAQLARLAGAFDGAVVTAPCSSSSHLVLPDPASFGEMTIENLKSLSAQVEAYHNQVEKELRDRALCVVCYTGHKEIVFYPCKHKSVCSACAEKLTECPICRKPIADKILPYDT